MRWPERCARSPARSSPPSSLPPEAVVSVVSSSRDRELFGLRVATAALLLPAALGTLSGRSPRRRSARRPSSPSGHLTSAGGQHPSGREPASRAAPAAVRPAQWVGDAPAPFLDVGRQTGRRTTSAMEHTAMTASTTTPSTRTAARAVNVSKSYGTRRRRRLRARRRQRRPRRRPVHRDHGPVRLRQVDPAARARRPRPPDLRRDLHRRHRDHLAQGQAADPAAPRPDRLHLPVVQPAPDADRGREHRAADADRRPQARRGLGRARSSRRSV